MKHWTKQAEARLAAYLRSRVAREGLHGAEAEELQDDLRRHLHEEAEGLEGDAIGLMQIEYLLGRLDGGGRDLVAPAPLQRKGGKISSFFLWLFGVVMPVGVLGFEVFSGACSAVLFNPIPTWWHVLAVALVPAVNVCCLKGCFPGRPGLLGGALGFALAVSFFYGLLFLPVIHFSLLGVIWFGFGLIPLTPVLCGWMTLAAGRRGAIESVDEVRFRRRSRLGLLCGILAIGFSLFPALWTRANLQAAASDKPEGGLARLRMFHSERVLLQACYEGNRGTQMSTDIAGWIMGGWTMPLGGWNPSSRVASDEARDLFFRVAGKPFNSVKPPRSAAGSSMFGHRDVFEEMEFDSHLGGDDVAVRLKDLDLVQSRLDGHYDSASGIGYGEWTMVFRNGSASQKEARCQVRLPAGGHVSRLTLWVNGEPQEAAFNTVAKVKAAYQSIAVVQRRDPVLVNVCAPDTVMVQCFPVPPEGEMKIRLGITAPASKGRWKLPFILERNFGISPSMEHAVWMQSDRGFSLKGTGGVEKSVREGDAQSLATAQEAEGVVSSATDLLVDAEEMGSLVWCKDPFAGNGERILLREKRAVPVVTSKPPVVVIDGSVSMAESKRVLVEALSKTPEVTVLLADDHDGKVSPDELERYRFSGGRDNEPALKHALRLAKQKETSVVWIHGPQAIRLHQSEALLQVLERGSSGTLIVDVEAVAGPNRLAEAIYRTGRLIRNPLPEFSAEALAQLLANPVPEQAAWAWNRAGEGEIPGGKEVWDQLARHYAATQVEDRWNPLPDDERAQLASRYQLVTLYSGAVVLERREQYVAHGLEQADPDATPQIPGIPEPSTGVLILVTVTTLAMRRRRCPAARE